MAGSTFGNLRVMVSADTSKFNKGLKSATKSLTTFQKTTRLLSSSFTKLFGGLLAGAATAGIAKAFLTTAAAIDETAKAARNLGIATEELIGLRHAAKLAGITDGTLSSGLKRFTRTTYDAATGLKSAGEAFNALGLDAKRLMDLSLDQQLRVVAQRLNGISNETEKAALRMELLGRAGSEMGVLLEAGSDGIGKAVKNARDLGMTFSAEQASKLEHFNDQFQRLKEIAGSQWKNFTIAVAPDAVKAITALLETVEGMTLLYNTIRSGKNAAVAGAGKWMEEQMPWTKQAFDAVSGAGARAGNAVFNDPSMMQGAGAITPAERARFEQTNKMLGLMDEQKRIEEAQRKAQEEQVKLWRDAFGGAATLGEITPVTISK